MWSKHLAVGKVFFYPYLIGAIMEILTFIRILLAVSQQSLARLFVNDYF